MGAFQARRECANWGATFEIRALSPVDLLFSLLASFPSSYSLSYMSDFFLHRTTRGNQAGSNQGLEQEFMTAYLGNIFAALVTIGLLVGTLRFSRRVNG